MNVATPIIGRDKFHPRVSTNGRKVMVDIAKPRFF